MYAATQFELGEGGMEYISRLSSETAELLLHTDTDHTENRVPRCCSHKNIKNEPKGIEIE